MNQTIKSPSALREQNNYTESPFVLMDVYDPAYDPFTFKDVFSIFKKKDAAEPKTVNTTSTGSGKGALSSILGGLFGLVSVAAPILPQIGIGSKSRINEAKAIAEANAMVYNSQLSASLAAQEASRKETEQLMMISGGVLFLLVIMVLLLKK